MVKPKRITDSFFKNPQRPVVHPSALKTISAQITLTEARLSVLLLEPIPFHYSYEKCFINRSLRSMFLILLTQTLKVQTVNYISIS